MRTLSGTLLAAQQSPSRIPYVSVMVSNKIAGVVRLDWESLYSGTETEKLHAATIPGDGSLVRVKVTLPGSGQTLYRQRVAGPGATSDFTQWVSTGKSSVLAATVSSLNAEVSIFWIDGSLKLQRLKSTDNGVTWGSAELISYVSSTAAYGITAAYKANGDLAVFYIIQNVLYVKKYVSGNWQSAAAWNKTTGDLSGVAGIYDGDWDLVVTGKDSSGNYKIWSLIYGDGGDVTAGTWAALQEIESAPAGGYFQFTYPTVDKPDVCRCFYTEIFSGTIAYNRPFGTYTVPDTAFLNNLWREPVPFNLDSDCCLSLTHQGDYLWLTCPAGVWRTSLNVQELDLSGDVLEVKEDLYESSGKLVIELRNDDGRYALPETGSLALLDIGNQVEFSPGYRTAAGDEVSTGMSFILESYEHVIAGGGSSVLLVAVDGCSAMHRWIARHQFRWNQSTPEMNVKQILEYILARVGLKLAIKSQSTDIIGYYPDFTIHPGNSGITIVDKLLSFVPDVLSIEGDCVYLINPLATDVPVYSYGMGHDIMEGKFRQAAPDINRVQVEGYDTIGSVPVIVDSFDWEENARIPDRFLAVVDENIDTPAQAQARGQAWLRKAQVHAAGGYIRTPVNCGQQLYDVVDITVAKAGLDADRFRVLGINMSYDPRRGIYEQRLLLGAV